MGKELEIEQLANELPFVYKLEQPRFMEASSHRITPFQYVIHALADRSGLDASQCLARWELLYQEMANDRTWLKGSDTLTDDELQGFIDRTLGRISHIRARIHPTIFALLRCIGEVWDAGLLDKGGMLALVHELLHHDPTMVLREPSPLPLHYNVDIGLKRDQSWLDLPENWVNPQEDAIGRLTTFHEQGWTVLAERSSLRGVVSNSLIEESRTSGYFGLKASELGSKSRSLPFVSPSRSTAEGYSTWSHLDETHLIVAQNNPMCETPGSRWLAVNPVVACSLGLKAGDGLFQWIDAQCSPAIETVWFSNGGLLNHAPGDRPPIVEGFLVLCNTTVMDRLAHRNLQRIGMIARSVDKNGDHQEGFIASELSGA